MEPTPAAFDPDAAHAVAIRSADQWGRWILDNVLNGDPAALASHEEVCAMIGRLQATLVDRALTAGAADHEARDLVPVFIRRILETITGAPVEPVEPPAFDLAAALTQATAGGLEIGRQWAAEADADPERVLAMLAAVQDRLADLLQTIVDDAVDAGASEEEAVAVANATCEAAAHVLSGAAVH